MLLIMIIKKTQEYCIHLCQVPSPSFGQLLYNSPENFISLKMFNSGFSHIDVWFTNQNSNTLEIEDKINIFLVIN